MVRNGTSRIEKRKTLSVKAVVENRHCTVTIGEKLKKENNKLNRAVHCVPDTISKVKIELDLNATINTK